VETLLAISGGDPLTVNRKYKDHVTLTLPSLIWMLSNTVPKLMDSSGVIASRFVVVQFRNSFLGREDPELEKKLEQELPGILKFAIDGYRALRESGSFTQPKSGLTVYRALLRGASDIIAFIQDRYVLDPASQELTEQVYQNYILWFTDTNQPGKPASKTVFGKELTEAHPQVSRVRFRVKGEYGEQRPYFYIGLRFHPHADDEDR
jgi:putative DNA primase/helicase